jgi:ABC-2 type transport system ATP-binding protein
MAVVWSTSYLDEAELCDEVLLMNEGQLLFAGKPADLTKNIHDRSFEITHIAGNRRELLTRTLKCPEVMDGVIQGKNIRIVLRKGAQKPSLQSLKAGDQAEYKPTPPRFEDAFIEALGGGPGGDSLLADRLKEVPGHHEVVIEAVELTKKFGNFTATDHVNFSVKRGEIFGLLGPNGAGKSTTFRMMCGLIIPTSGTAHVMGIDLRESPSKARQQLGYMAQKFSLYQDLTVRQNLNFFSGVYGLKRARQKEAVDEMVEVFKLHPFLDITPGTLPLGFKQRLALACAVMHQPPILFLDEPTSGVDPVTRREFWMHINGAVSKGVTVMVTTHFMDEASYCDRIALVYRGKMIAIGTPDELKDQVATPELPNPTMEDAFIGLIEQHSVEVPT